MAVVLETPGTPHGGLIVPSAGDVNGQSLTSKPPFYGRKLQVRPLGPLSTAGGEKIKKCEVEPGGVELKLVECAPATRKTEGWIPGTAFTPVVCPQMVPQPPWGHGV